jgi:translation elongation factor EF-Tu-like GTPase
MKPESAGGRHGPFNEGYCPHLVAVGKTEWLAVRVVRCPELVYLGEEKELEFELMYSPRLDYSDLAPGSAFSIHEGPKTVGTGVVIS